MTNKINGIDVSECDYFEKQHIEDMYESDDCNVCIDNFCALCWKECEKYNGCYFKQLKRLEQENKSLQMLSCANCGEKYLSPDGSELYEKNVQLKTENAKYKQALEEIREIVSGNYEILDPQAKQDIKKLIDEVLK